MRFLWWCSLYSIKPHRGVGTKSDSDTGAGFAVKCTNLLTGRLIARHLPSLRHPAAVKVSDIGRLFETTSRIMLGIWARGLRPRPGPPLSGVTSPRLSNSRRQQTLAALQVSRDYRHLRQKLDFGVIPSPSSSRIWQINCRFNSTQSSFQQNVTPRKTTILSRFLPAPILSKTPQNVSSLRKIFAFAKPEKKPLLIAIGLLLVSSTVSMSVPFTIGKLIDFFSSSNSVRIFSLYTALLLKSCIANTT